MKKITFLMICLMATFLANAQFASMAIVGDGAGGWPTGAAGEVDAHQMVSEDGVNWTYDDLVTYNGSIKFRAENSWTNNWGGATFPSGTGLFDSQTNNIPNTIGIFDVTFNSTTLEYNFVSQNLYPVISLTGPGLDGMDWDQDYDLFTTDGTMYTVYGVPLIVGAEGPGEVKFRQDHAWTINWGADSWPAGTGVQDGASIPIAVSGTYNVTFNRTTGEYWFAFPKIALVGSATPQGWPSDPQVDAHELTSTDGVVYTLNTIDLIDGAAKFRQDNAWNVQWGGDGGFPTGTGSQGGTDIPVVAGTYSVTLNKSTGAYAFGAPIAATNTFNKGVFSVYPNPTQSSWNFAASSDKIETIQIVDVLGKTILSIAPKGTNAIIDASGLSSGMYFAKVSVNGATQTIRLIKN
jgi:hypothetical protein